ncbi:hypothetical protein Sjap_022449 [Stephania japonica]|uniref:Uncharacterized protein n=1 Tax=Stephania japonica TaxID=461633 RepID=A0AAP0ES11_9MAGN
MTMSRLNQNFCLASHDLGQADFFRYAENESVLQKATGLMELVFLVGCLHQSMQSKATIWPLVSGLQVGWGISRFRPDGARIPRILLHTGVTQGKARMKIVLAP